MTTRDLLDVIGPVIRRRLGVIGVDVDVTALTEACAFLNIISASINHAMFRTGLGWTTGMMAVVDVSILGASLSWAILGLNGKTPVWQNAALIRVSSGVR